MKIGLATKSAGLASGLLALPPNLDISYNTEGICDVKHNCAQGAKFPPCGKIFHHVEIGKSIR